MAITESELEALYKTELGRSSPDAAGMEYWMQSGLTPEQIKSQFSDIATQPGFQEAAKEADIVNLYQEELGRTQVDDPGLDYWMESTWETEQIARHFDLLEEGQLHNEGLIVWDEDPTDTLLRLKRDPLGDVTTGEGTVGATWWRTDQEIQYTEGWTEADKLLDIKQTLGKGDVFGSEGRVGASDFGTGAYDPVTGFDFSGFDFNAPDFGDWDPNSFNPVGGKVQRPDMLLFANDPLEENMRTWDIDTRSNVGTVVADYLDTGRGFLEFREELPGGEYEFGGSPRREAWRQTDRAKGILPSTTRGQAGVEEPVKLQGRDRSGTKQRKSGFSRSTTGAQI